MSETTQPDDGVAGRADSMSETTLQSEDKAWGVLCDVCGLLPIAVATREKARMWARYHRRPYEQPKPAVTTVRVRVALAEAPR